MADKKKIFVPDLDGTDETIKEVTVRKNKPPSMVDNLIKQSVSNEFSLNGISMSSLSNEQSSEVIQVKVYPTIKTIFKNYVKSKGTTESNYLRGLLIDDLIGKGVIRP